MGMQEPDIMDLSVAAPAEHAAVEGLRLALVQRERKRKLAVLVSHTDIVSPSSFSSLRHFAGVIAQHNVEATLIGAEDLPRLAQFDGLFIRHP